MKSFLKCIIPESESDVIELESSESIPILQANIEEKSKIISIYFIKTDIHWFYYCMVIT